MNNYHLYLDYLELRRRVERHLSRALPVVAHIIIFAVVANLIGWNGYKGIRDPNDYYFIAPEFGRFLAGWSGVLLVHTLWQTLRSSLPGYVRNRAIEKEMRARLELNDSYLTDDPKMLFRLHGLLEENIRMRGGFFILLLATAILNAMIWIPWALDEPRTSRGWMIAQTLEVIVLVTSLIYGAWRSGKENQLRKQLEALPPVSNYNPPAEEEVTFRLQDDGELVDFPISSPEQKKKRS